MNNFKIIHSPTGIIIAEGTTKDGLKSFEGNYYVKTKYFKPAIIKTNYVPGLCFYKFIYIWMDLILPDGGKVRNIGWKYIIPNPIFYIVIGRVGLPKNHPELSIEEY